MGSKYCPESPRQKMISMMYLVLTAMLALNVAAETLYAFKIVDESLMKTYLSFSSKNESLISDFEYAYENNQGKVETWRNLANDVHAQSDSLVKYIIDVKEELALMVDSYIKEPEEELSEEMGYVVTNSNDTIVLKGQDDLNASPELMLTRGRGKEIQNKIGEYKAFLSSLADNNEALIRNIESSIDVSDPDRHNKIGDENYRSWAHQNFQHTPAIASVTLLSKLQIDIRNAESAMLRHLYNQIDASSFKFTGLKATVIPDASYIFQGQEYRARIFLSAEDSTRDLEVFINNGSNALKTEEGEAIYSTTPAEPGEYTYKGRIKYLNPEGDGFNYVNFERSFEVAKPTATVSAMKMNVLFKDLKNPIDISVPNVPANKIMPECTNGKMYREGETWIVEPKKLDVTGNETKIIVYADFDGEKRKMTETVYRVMRVPSPVAKVAGLTSGSISMEKLRMQILVSAVLENFYFDLRFEVIGFNMVVPSGGGMMQSLPSRSYRFTSDQKRMLGSLGPGDKVIIEDIKARIEGDENADIRSLSPVILTIQ